MYQKIGDQETCPNFTKNSSLMFGFTNGCLTMSRWDQLNVFFKNSGAKVVFGLNALSGRTIGLDGTAIGSWDSSEAEALIRYTANKGYIISGWELGNELSGTGIGTSVTAQQYASDTISLQNLVQKIYAGFQEKPIVLGPGGFYDANWFNEYVTESLGSLQAITQHIYNLGPGGNYGLLNTTTFVPNPDYYSALLWHRLMGRQVLSTSFVGTNKIRSYAHCSKTSAGITLLVINLDGFKTTNIGVFIENTTTVITSTQQNATQKQRTKFSKMLRNPRIDEAQRDEYHLTAKDGDLHSQIVLLNGVELLVNSSGVIPSLEPIQKNFSSPISVAPFSIVFVHIPTIRVPACT
ncbi:putative glycosidase [Helianthus annuus]|nr:putative glycosidase [Helianthus annuus]